jgi:hypothetical protein
MAWRHMGKWRYSSTVLDITTIRCRCVVSFTPLPLYLRGKSSLYPLDRRLDGPQSRSGRYGEGKDLALPGIEPGPRSPLSLAIPTELSRYAIKFRHCDTDPSTSFRAVCCRYLPLYSYCLITKLKYLSPKRVINVQLCNGRQCHLSTTYDATPAL